MVSLTLMARLLEALAPDDPAGARRRPGPARLGRGRRGARRPRRPDDVGPVEHRRSARRCARSPTACPTGAADSPGRGAARVGRAAADACTGSPRGGRSRSSPQPCAPAAPTTRWRCCASGAGRAGVRRDRRTTHPIERRRARPRCRSRRGHERAVIDAARAGDADGRARRARPAPAAVRAPRRPARRAALERRRSSAGSPPTTRCSCPRLDGRYAGQPLLVTANDYENGLYNGDTGVVVRTRRRAGRGVPARRRAGAAAAGAAVRRPPAARDDRAPRAGQPVRRGDRAAAAGRLAARHPADASTPRSPARRRACG